MQNSTVIDVLAEIVFKTERRALAKVCLTEFTALNAEERAAALPSTIERIFPLAFGEEAAVEKSEAYAKLHSKPWSTNCWLTPKVIVSPSTAQGVSKALTLCKFLGATFSIRGGGHLQNPGFCSNDGGVVIGLSSFRDITVSEDKSRANIGLGLTWLEVYQALNEHGVAVTGGRMPQVGVPGLLLGGGLSFQNSEHGFSCSAVINYEVVLADSTIINVNAKENSDLFWALKGGCGNFGIVTSVEMSTVPNQIWAEARIYQPSENERLLEAMMKYHEAIEKTNKAVLYFHVVNQATLIVYFYCEPVENPEVFNCFYDIPFMKKFIEPGCKTVLDVIQGIADVLDTTPLLHEMRTMSSLPDLEVYKAAEACRKQKVEELKDVEGLVFTMSFQPISSGAIKASEEKGGTPMGIAPNNQQWFLIMADWKHAKDEHVVREACREITETAEKVAKMNDTYLPFVYSNYASRDQNPLASYGVENLARLKEIALRYDPHQIFQTLQNGGWLLSRA